MALGCFNGSVIVGGLVIVFVVISVGPGVLLKVKEYAEADEPVALIGFVQRVVKKRVAAPKDPRNFHFAVFVDRMPEPLLEGLRRLHFCLGIRIPGIVHSLINRGDDQGLFIGEANRTADDICHQKMRIFFVGESRQWTRAEKGNETDNSCEVAERFSRRHEKPRL